jgi:hypothetical protein
MNTIIQISDMDFVVFKMFIFYVYKRDIRNLVTYKNDIPISIDILDKCCEIGCKFKLMSETFDAQKYDHILTTRGFIR